MITYEVNLLTLAYLFINLLTLTYNVCLLIFKIGTLTHGGLKDLTLSKNFHEKQQFWNACCAWRYRYVTDSVSSQGNRLIFVLSKTLTPYGVRLQCQNAKQIITFIKQIRLMHNGFSE